MDTTKYTNMNTTISGASDYCRLASYKDELTTMFEKQLAAINAQIAELTEWTSLSTPAALLSKITSLASAGLATAQAELAVVTAKQAEIMASLTSKLASLEAELRAKLENGGSVDLTAYCSTKEGWS